MTGAIAKPKRRFLRVLMLAVLTIAVVSSSATAWYTVGPGSIFKNVHLVRHGQSREEIVRLLGEPDSKRWRVAEFSQPADSFSYGDFREEVFISIVQLGLLVGIDPPEILHPGYDLHFDEAGRLDEVTSNSPTVIRMFNPE